VSVSRIEVIPDQVTRMGEGIVGVAQSSADLAGLARTLGSAAHQPPATAAALGWLASAWGAGALRLEEDLMSLGRSSEAAGFLYRLTDSNAIPVSAATMGGP